MTKNQPSGSSPSASNRKMIAGHPAGLFILFFTELWERFSYYGMRAILTLYMFSSATGDNPGLGWDKGDAITLYGWYTMLVYVMSIPGGIVADKIFGQKRTVLYGGLLLCLGHGILAIEELWAFYTGLLLIVIGVGGLKPNISSMVGGLYDPNDDRREKGFTIFYIGINIGAFLAALIVGWVGETVGWHYGFGLAGIGMLIGQAVFMLGQKHLEGVGEKPVSVIRADATTPEEENMFVEIFKHPTSLIPTLAIIFLGGYIAIEHSLPYGILTMFLALGLGVILVIYRDITKVERDRLSVVLISFLIVIVFWGAFEQAGGLMNIYTLEKIDRNFLGIEIPASAFQSVNAFFIITLGGAIASFWVWWKRSGKESSSLFKMAIGTMIMGLGFVFMGIASQQASAEVGAKGMMILLILAYLFHTIGELCASPVALSFVTKLSPVKYVSIMMGFYFAATGLGNKLAGAIGSASQTKPVEIELVADKSQLTPYVADSIFDEGANFKLSGDLAVENGSLTLTKESESIEHWFRFEEEAKSTIKSRMDAAGETQMQAVIRMEKDELRKEETLGTAEAYKGSLAIHELENQREFQTFMLIFFFTLAFGLLLLLFLKKLKKLTHGAEDKTGTQFEEQEGFEIVDQSETKRKS